jgi:Mrp family chromosome partitioning ATPase
MRFVAAGPSVQSGKDFGDLPRMNTPEQRHAAPDSPLQLAPEPPRVFRAGRKRSDMPRMFRDRRDRASVAPSEWQATSVDPGETAHSSSKKRFDEMRINFIARYARQGIRSILIVGTARGDGASTSAFNFAASLARDADTQVALVNADLRASAGVSRRPNPPGTPGLVTLSYAGEVPAQPGKDANERQLPASSADPAVLFQSRRFDGFMVHLGQQFDYIIIDGPPLEEAPESIALSAKVDGVILVIDAQHTRRKIALRAKTRIEEVGGRLLGVVLNRRRYYVPSWLYKVI